jgi:hypothetical protein
MLSNECNRNHLPSYETTCCLKQLLIMNEWAENQMMISKYSNLFFKTLNHFFKRDKLDYENMKLDLLKLFLQVITKFVTFYFNLEKWEYSKILIKIGLKACEINAFCQHPDIILRKIAILSNLSCIYSK